MRALPVLVALVALAGCASNDATRDPTTSAVDTELKPDATGCYRNLPAPKIAASYAFSTARYDDYAIQVTNWSRFPDELFVAAPDLPPCGLNTKAARSWVEMYRPNGERLYGYCALTGGAHDLSSGMYYMVPAGSSGDVYLEIWDRRCNLRYRSAAVAPDA